MVVSVPPFPLSNTPLNLIPSSVQGQETDQGSVVKVRSRHTSTDGANGGSYTIPNYADFLVFQVQYRTRQERGVWKKSRSVCLFIFYVLLKKVVD